MGVFDDHLNPPAASVYRPPGWLFLFDAYQVVGLHLFDDEWSGAEHSAHPTAAVREEEERLRAALKRTKKEILASSVSPRQLDIWRKFIADADEGLLAPPKPEDEAFERHVKALGRLRDILATGEASAYVLPDLDDKRSVPVRFWRSDACRETLAFGKIQVAVVRESLVPRGVGRWVMVRHADLEQVLSGIEPTRILDSHCAASRDQNIQREAERLWKQDPEYSKRDVAKAINKSKKFSNARESQDKPLTAGRIERIIKRPKKPKRRNATRSR